MKNGGALKRTTEYLKDPLLLISAAAALVSAFFVHPDSAYLDYPDLRTLSLLFSLMACIAGSKKAGLFDRVTAFFSRHSFSSRLTGALLIFISFFSAMIITNDVALICFTPLTIMLLGSKDRIRDCCKVVVLQTIAANTGSMLTPLGNPQNLFLQSHFGLGIGDFISVTLPFFIASGLLLSVCVFAIRPGSLPNHELKEETFVPGRTVFFAVLFTICLLAVFRIIPWQVLVPLTVAALLLVDRSVFAVIDYKLLLTFFFFFIFSGNLARIPSLASFLREAVKGRELIAGILTSQFISNVPSALLLAGFVENASDLLLAVNIGGIGTPIASLASLISIRILMGSDLMKKSPAPGSRLLFWKTYLVFNSLFLAALIALRMAIE